MLIATAVVLTACAAPDTAEPGHDESGSELQQIAQEILRAEEGAGVGAVAYGNGEPLIVYIHGPAEDADEISERLTATYGVAIQVKEGAPVPADG
ncbi:hypothetical protein [Cellulomonas hominis]